MGDQGMAHGGMSNLSYQPFQALIPFPEQQEFQEVMDAEEAFLPQGGCSGLHLLKDDWIADFAASQLSTPTAARALTTAQVPTSCSGRQLYFLEFCLQRWLSQGYVQCTV